MGGNAGGRWATAAALALLLSAVALLAGGDRDAPAAVRKPNIVLITTDDQTLASMAVMPRVRRLLVDRGATFSDNIASFPLCCPSRATRARLRTASCRCRRRSTSATSATSQALCAAATG